MAMAGGQSTAAGMIFQALAIARAIVDVYQGHLDFVRAEVPPHADFGQVGILKVYVEDYVIQRAGKRIYHQAKSNAPGGGNWTPTKLWKEEILQKFVKQLADDSDSECCLVTASDCSLFGKVADQARAVTSAAEFAANLTAEHQRLIEDACRKLSIDKTKFYELLLRSRLQISSSKQFRQDLNSLSSVLFADPIAALDCLLALAMGAMETGQSLDHATIERHLSERSVFEKPRATEAEILTAVRDASSRLRNVGKDIGGVHIQQPTVDKMFEWVINLDSTATTVAALLDQAGSGKTVAISVLLNRLENAGFVVLGIKADGLAFSSHAELASAIGLHDSIPSMLQCLQAAGHRIALLIDQVDALSSAMSRESSSITVVLDLVARIARLRIPIVLACRSFDWKYDYRLRQLREGNPVEFSLPELTDEQLAHVLSVCSLQPNNLHPLTIRVIRCPLRLKILVEVVQARRKADPDWKPGNAIYTQQSLYQEFWTLITGKAVSDGIAANECEDIVITLARNMHDSKHLSAPEVIVADLRPARDWLISEGILCLHGTSLSFFHQTFFDFIFARWFVRNGQPLVKHLLGSDQGLFYRPMVRQILEYMRDATPPRYVAELKGILEDNRIRRHLRWLAIALLGYHRDPKVEELDLLEPFLSRDKTRRRVLSLLRSNTAWFDLLTAQRFDRWLRTLPDAEAWLVGGYLSSVLPERQREIATLLSPYVGKSNSLNEKIELCLAQIKSGWDNLSIDLLYDILRSPLTNLELKFGWWATALESLAKSLPVRGCEAVGIILNRFRECWAISDDKHLDSIIQKLPKIHHGLPMVDDFAETLAILGNDVPTEFLKCVLPWTLTAMQVTCSSINNLSFKKNWQYWDYGHDHNDNPSGKLLAAIGIAATKLAKDNPSLLRSLVPTFLDGQYFPIQVIIAEAYGENPSEFAADAAAFLNSDPRRLRLYAHGSSIWYTTQIIKACCSHWSDEDFRRVEIAILTMKPYPARSVGDLHGRYIEHLGLLQALDQARLSVEGLNRRRELERRYPGYIISPPKRGEVGWVGAPIRQDAIKKMDDSCWLRAMHKYEKNHEYNNKPIELSGGRIELSGALQAAAKEQPERFLALAMNRMDTCFHADYVMAIISGIAEAGLPAECLEPLIQKFLPQLEKGNVRMVTWAIEKYAGKNVPQSLIDLLKRWVEHAPAPVINDGVTEVGGRDQDDQNDLFIAGLNSDRGAALSAIAVVLLKFDPPRRGEYLDIVEKVAVDPSLAVRAVGIEYLQYSIPADPIRACDMFYRLIGQNQLLLRTRGAYDFVYRSLSRHATKVLWAIVRMLSDVKSPQTREAGAKLACLAAFEYSDAAPLRDSCIKGDAPARKGAAIVYSSNITEVHVGKECRERLLAFMNDEDEEVRREATTFLRELEASCLHEIADFLRAWAQTKSLDEGAENAAYMLKQNPVVDLELTLDISDRLIDVLGREIVNMQSRYGIIPYNLTPAILNVYHRSSDARTRGRAIDLFEKLDELGCPEIHSALESVDRL